MVGDPLEKAALKGIEWSYKSDEKAMPKIVNLCERDTEMPRKLMRILKKLREEDPVYYQLCHLVRHSEQPREGFFLLTNLVEDQVGGMNGYVDVIGIDEAQFFDDLYDFCCKAADCDGKIVIVVGLDGDYLRRTFGSVLDIIPLADSITKLTARCELCGKRVVIESARDTLESCSKAQTDSYQEEVAVA
ncbi:unnamed protein product [Camellia sinensis]